MLKAFRVVAEAVFSTSSGPPPPARMDWLVTELEDFMGRSGSYALFIMRLSLFALMVFSPLFIFAWPTLARLDVARRIEALTRMEESFASAPVLAVKAFICAIYYEHPEVERELGYGTFGPDRKVAR